ncbi:stress-responsive transcriptional activator [Maudiozyma humilis]|uniref:Stress-responsive transcriptional activator n=1 Tax=Maudiozyma humilis TaxID=51915 RepID=A0AAV5RQN7_MAUHU|nr:stress-responsive transcriptional activator [Kazachstania humilis]
MQSTLFDTVLGGESMFSPQAPVDATATASASAKERALEAQDEFLGGLETSVTPVDQNAAASAAAATPAQPGHTDSNSSATTKLNTANNSFLDLQQLNGAGATAPGPGPGPNAPTTLLAQNTMYNLESLSTPSAMNDLLAMLDQEEDLNSTQPHSRLMSPKASYDASYDASNEIPGFGMRAASNSFLDADMDAFPQGNANNSNEHLLPDIAEDNYATDPARKNSYVDPASTLALGGSLGNALVAGNPTPAGAAMHSSGMGWARRASELVSASQPPPQMSMAPRQSISDSVDFWNLGSGPAPMHSQQQQQLQQQQHRGSTSPLSPGNTHHRYSINEELSQALSGYNLNFSGSGGGAADSNADSAIDMLSDNDADAELQMGLGSPRQSVSVDFSLSSPHQPRAMNRGSVSAGAGASATAPPGNELFYNLYSANDQLGGDYYHNMSMSSDDMPGPAHGITPANVQSGAATNAIPQDDLASPRKKFIKPSMMLADSASISAKLAFSGLQKKPETFPTIDTQSFHHPSKIVKRKSVSSTTPVNLRADQSRRRRKSTIGISSMSSFSTSPRNSASSSSMAAESAAAAAAAAASSASMASAKRNSSSNIAVSLLEDASAKPFQCKDCDKAFRRSEHLKRHVRSVHSTERPFPCMLCEKKFSRSDNLSQHLKTHKKHGDF